jgi:hypothetical protein
MSVGAPAIAGRMSALIELLARSGSGSLHISEAVVDFFAN